MADVKSKPDPDSLPIGFADVEAAAKTIRGAVENTPAAHSRTLSAIMEAEIFLKFEIFQFTGAFKERGALNKLCSLSTEQRARGVVAMSAGNHAQGVAYHAGRLGIPATIVMPEGTPFTKMPLSSSRGRACLKRPTPPVASRRNKDSPSFIPSTTRW